VRAQAVGHNLGQAAQQALAVPQPVPNVGDTPPAFNPKIEEYSHFHILGLIVFYNDDFGIALVDTLPTRIQKVRRFLAEF
jgi:hypothetical protein